MTKAPERGFALSEFEARTERAQRMMRDEKLDAMLFTTEAHVRYFSGFLTQFWQSPTRPWFLLLPLSGKPIAVIPSIGVAGMQQSWVDDIRSWSSPQPQDDGISLLLSTIREIPRRFGRLGMTLGNESYLRMPALDYRYLETELTEFELADCADLMLRLCSVKSSAEIAKISYVLSLIHISEPTRPPLLSRMPSSA